MLMNQLKTAIYIENYDLYRKQQFKSKTTTKTTIFDQIRPIFDINRTIFDINGPDSNRIVATSRSDRWNQIVKFD